MEKDEFDKIIESLDKASDLLEKASDSLEELIGTYQTYIDFHKEIYHRVLIFFILLMVLGIVSIIAMMSIY